MIVNNQQPVGKAFYDPACMPKGPAFSVEEQVQARGHLDQIFELMQTHKHVNELDPVTRELFRDLRGTMVSFMQGVS